MPAGHSSGWTCSGPNEAIISQATAVQFYRDSTGQSALGRRFRELPGGPWMTIVGVVGNTRDTSLAAPPSMAVYYPQVPSSGGLDTPTRWTMALVVRTAGEPSAITSAVQRVVRDLDPGLPVFQIRTMTAVAAASMGQLSFTILVLGAAALVTLVLGAVGLYGVMAYVVSLRTRELAVRIALGATPGAIIRMLTTQGVAVTAFGIGGGLALFVGRCPRAAVAALRGGIDGSGYVGGCVAVARRHRGLGELAASAADFACGSGRCAEGRVARHLSGAGVDGRCNHYVVSW